MLSTSLSCAAPWLQAIATHLRTTVPTAKRKYRHMVEQQQTAAQAAVQAAAAAQQLPAQVQAAAVAAAQAYTAEKGTAAVLQPLLALARTTLASRDVKGGIACVLCGCRRPGQ